MDSAKRKNARKRKLSKAYNDGEYPSSEEEDDLFEMEEEEEDDEDLSPEKPTITRTTHAKRPPKINKKVKLDAAKLESIRLACHQLLTTLMQHQYASPFSRPVDPALDGAPDYYVRIKRPMDFGTIQKKIDSRSYHTVDKFADDVRLVFTNCWLYNRAGSVLYEYARTLSTHFEKLLRSTKKKDKGAKEQMEIGEMQEIINELRAEHHKLLQELHKLLKEHKNETKKLNGMLPLMPALQAQQQQTQQASSTPIKPETSNEKKTSATKQYTLNSKQELREKISTLSPENLQKMVQVIENDLPEKARNSTELELDLEALSDAALQKLEHFVNECLKQNNNAAHSDSSSSSSESSSDDEKTAKAGKV